MEYARLFLPTMKETPSDAEVISHKLMFRAGMIRKVATGIYTYLPFGLRALRKVEAIIREEMDGAGAQEILMPMVQPSDLWIESGRWDYYGKELLRLKAIASAPHMRKLSRILFGKRCVPTETSPLCCIRFKPSSGMKSAPGLASCGPGNSS